MDVNEPERREQFRPEVRVPLTKPISVSIEPGTIEWDDSVVRAERIRSYQEGECVGELIRRIECKRNETHDGVGAAADTFVPNRRTS